MATQDDDSELSQDVKTSLKELQAKYARMRKEHPVRSQEPKGPAGSGMSVGKFLDLLEDTSKNYQPSGYLKGLKLD